MKNANFLAELVYNDSKPAIKLILESESSKEIRILMKKGQLMKEHKTAYPIVIQIIAGRIEFEVEGNKHDLETGAILSLKGNVPHSLLAQEDSIVRLSLSKNDTELRVKSVLD